MMPRAEALGALESERFEVVVVGGGITGVGVALDAASRGYRVALLEREDYASGTSSRSSKLIHGGLRYLRNFDLGLVREALLERSLMVRLAPGLVSPLAILVPALEGRPDPITGLGLNFYDAVVAEPHLRERLRPAGGEGQEYWAPSRHRRIGGEEVVRLIPALAGRHPSSAYLFHDAQCDDVRLVLAVLRQAELRGAVPVNRCEVLSLLDDGGRTAGVACRDAESGREIEVRADHVVNATGVWADRLRPPDGAYGADEVPRISPSRGTHVMVSNDALPMEAGAIVPAAGGRTIFVLPWLGRTLIGTTDRDYDGPLEHVPSDREDIDYLLDACNTFFGLSLGLEDLTGAYAGVRPLISTGDPRDSVDISREAAVFETGSGLVTITGGKYTTWRRMAKAAVDRVVAQDGRRAPCVTDRIHLSSPPEPLPPLEGVHAASLEHLAGRYGTKAIEVLTIGHVQPELRARIVPDMPDLLLEAVYAARREQARSVGDVLLRRTRLGILDARRLAAEGAEGARSVAEAMGRELGWDSLRVESEASAWREEAAAEGLVPA